jgi:hypothetical protein
MDPFEKFKGEYGGLFLPTAITDDERGKAFLNDRLQLAFAQGQQSMVASRPKAATSIPITSEWTKKIEKVGEAAFKLGNASFFGNQNACMDQAGGLLDDLLKIARELDAEVRRLGEILGTKATEEMIKDHLDAFGSAFVFEGRLLDPTKVVIRIVKETASQRAPANYEVVRRIKAGDPWPTPPMRLIDLAVYAGADAIEAYWRGHMLKFVLVFDDEGLTVRVAFASSELREAEDPYGFIKDRVTARVAEERSQACPKEADSPTSSTGESPSPPSKEDSTTASPEEGAGSDTCPFAETTSERNPKDKPASDPQ